MDLDIEWLSAYVNERASSAWDALTMQLKI